MQNRSGAGFGRRTALGLSGAALLAAVRPARGETTIRIAIGQRGNWENSDCELGQGAGFFRKRGLVLDILYTEGGGQTQQAVISGSVDLGVGVGTYGVLGAFAKGAPVRIIGNSTDGAHDLYWYVPANSPIKSMRDAAGKTVAYSTTGSSTNLVVLGLERTLGIKLQPVATGSQPGTYTQVMSGQIDVGWAAPPFGLEALNQGKIRIIARGSDVPEFADQSVRVMIANAGFLARHPDTVAQFMQAYRETLDWLYSDPKALAAYAAWAGVPQALGQEARDNFYPKQYLDPDRVLGMPALVADAVTYKYLNAPLSAEQIRTLVQVPAKI
jgi:NitT/TauT family transport system substrate-binding protein